MSTPTTQTDDSRDRHGGSESFVFRLPPELRSVGQARAKLAELANVWALPPEVLDDARVVLSELMSNGVLHARTELQVVMSQRGDGLRLEVHDTSAAPLLPPAMTGPPAGSPVFDPPVVVGRSSHPAQPAATGRGLAMVAALASAWGWFPDASGGKVVWAELGTPASTDGGGGHSPSARPSEAVRPVRLIAMPVRLLKASEDQFDDLFRELQMANLALPGHALGDETGPRAVQSRAMDGRAPELRPRGPGAVPGDVVEMLAPWAESIKARLSRMREPVRRAIWEATRRGDRLLDLNLLADAGVPRAFAMFERLLQHAAVAARHGLLLTEPPEPEVVQWRRWLRAELEMQIAGKPPRACPFPVVPVDEEVGGPALAAQDSARRQALAELRNVLKIVGSSESQAGPGYGDDTVMAQGLAAAVELVGARRSVLCLLGEDNETVRFGASVGFSADVVDYWQAYSLSADLPASEAIRTNRAVLFRTFAELDTRYPVFLTTPSESDPALACVPLRLHNGQAFGCMVLGFPQARDFSSREIGFLEQIGDVISASILGRRATIEQVVEQKRQQAVSSALEAIRSAHARDDVLRELVDVTVGTLFDGASVHVVESSGTVRYAMARHRDPERLAAAIALLQKAQRRVEDPQQSDMVSDCARTGQPMVVQLLSDEAMTAGAVDDEDLLLLRRVALGSVGVMPVSTAKGTAAVLSFGNNVGRFINDRDLAALSGLASAAGEALARLGY